MAKDISPVETTARSSAERQGELPNAPLAMPRQVLEHPKGLFARLRPVWGPWLRAQLLGN